MQGWKARGFSKSLRMCAVKPGNEQSTVTKSAFCVKGKRPTKACSSAESTFFIVEVADGAQAFVNCVGHHGHLQGGLCTHAPQDSDAALAHTLALAVGHDGQGHLQEGVEVEHASATQWTLATQSTVASCLATNVWSS